MVSSPIFSHKLLCVSLLFFVTVQAFAADETIDLHKKNPSPSSPKNKTANYGPKTPGPIIEATCSTSKTVFYDLCIHSLRANDDALNSYWDSLPKISVTISLNNITNTHNYVNDLFKKTTDTCLKDHLDTCNKKYACAVKTILASFKYFNSYEFGLIIKNLKAAHKEISLCEEDFKKEQNPLASRNKMATQLLTVAIDLVSLLDAPPKKPKTN